MNLLDIMCISIFRLERVAHIWCQLHAQVICTDNAGPPCMEFVMLTTDTTLRYGDFSARTTPFAEVKLNDCLSTKSRSHGGCSDFPYAT